MTSMTIMCCNDSSKKWSWLILTLEMGKTRSPRKFLPARSDVNSLKYSGNYVPCRTSGSQGGEYVDGCLLGCSAVQYGRSLPTFQRCLLLALSGRSLVNFYETARCNNPQHSHLYNVPSASTTSNGAYCIYFLKQL
jgi:hypothetical protein